MIPDGFFNLTIGEPSILPSNTYYVDPATKRIVGMVDGAEAAQQAAQKALKTERFAYEIYDDTYGSEFERLIGQDMAYVIATAKKFTEETLLSDERFISVENFEILSASNNTISFTCDVVSMFGAIEVNRS